MGNRPLDRCTLEESLSPEQMIPAMARYWVRQWASRQDQRALIEDVTMAGWIAWLEHTSQPARQKIETQNAMQEAITYWLYGVSRGQRPRRWHPGGSLGLAASVPDIAPQALLRVGLQRLWDRLGRRGKILQTARRGQVSGRHARQVLRLMADTGLGANVPKALQRQYHLGTHGFVDGKHKIQDLAQALELGELAEAPPGSRSLAARHRLRQDT